MREEAQIIELSSRMPSLRVYGESGIPRDEWTDFRMAPTRVDLGRLQDLAEQLAGRFRGPKLPPEYLAIVVEMVKSNIRNATAAADPSGKVTIYSWDTKGRYEYSFFLQSSWLRK